MNPVVRTYSGYNQYTVRDAKNIRWTSLYGSDGSGFGVLAFDLDRDASVNHLDIGLGYEVMVTKYLTTILFHGHIAGVDGSSSGGVQSIKVQAVGEVAVADDDEIWHVFSDTRLDRWVTPGETPAGKYRPDLFSTGASEHALFINPNSGVDIDTYEYTALQYKFVLGETAERLKCTVSSSPGAGILFDGTVASIDDINARVYYVDLASGENNVYADMVLHNITKGSEVTITSLDRAANWFGVASASLLNGWAADDELTVYGPPFRALVGSVVGAVVTYTDEVGESNLANAFPLVNITKSSLAEIASYDTGADTITASDALMVSGWEEGDEIATGYPLFVATLNGAPSGTTVNYTPQSGERLVALDTGWTLYNVTRNDVATVATWTPGLNSLTVTDVADIVGWANSDIIHIYAPIRFAILDGNGTVLWNSPDVRMGDVPAFFDALDANTSGSPDSVFIYAVVTIACSFYGSMSVLQIGDVSIRSTAEDITASLIAKYVLSVLDDGYHGIDSSDADIEVLYDRDIDAAAYFEQQETPRAVMAWACSFGNSNGDAIAWGIRMDSRKRFFLETQPSDEIAYVVRGAERISADAGAKMQGSSQWVRAAYQDAMGQQQFTAWQTDTDAYFGNYAIRKTIRLDGAYTDAEAVAMAQLYLENNSGPKRTSGFRVRDGSVFTPLGVPVPIDELKATGRSARVRNWMFAESDPTSGGGIARQVVEPIVAVDVDYNNRTATLTPAYAVDTFEKLIGDVAKMRGK